MKKEIIKNNFWNRVFHHKELITQKEKYLSCVSLIGYAPIFKESLKRATTLVNLLDIHKNAWKLGFQNKNLGPCPYGMFRTQSIPDMTIDEVYLGNIWGLWTNTIRFWDTHSPDETMAGNGFGIPEDTKIYDLIMDQYRKHLSSNFTSIEREARNYARNFEIYS